MISSNLRSDYQHTVALSKTGYHTPPDPRLPYPSSFQEKWYLEDVMSAHEMVQRKAPANLNAASSAGL